VSKPHGRIVRDKDAWYIEDCGSTGGTQLNNKRIEKNVRTLLHDGDLIELAKGVSGARLLAVLPNDH
jgi:pSer/pThr/pTyr-binding forkhead associated (FHA) protein